MDFVQFLDMIVHVDKTLGLLIEQYGTLVYAVLFAIMFCETGRAVLFFFPGDTLLFIAGAFCATGQMHLGLLIALLVTAAVTGNTLNYWIGEAIGQRVFTHDYRWINKDAMRRTHEFFEKHGGKTIILARFVPVVRTFAPFVAGISDMTHARFQMYNVTGALLWVVGLVTAGYFFGNIPWIRDHLTLIVLIGVGAAVVKAAPPPPPPVARGTHWSYEGDSGPANWSKINVDWAKCGNGSRQSPIDIRDGMKVELEQISFDYHPSSFNVVDNGHTVQVGVSGGNYITVQNRMFELQQFHFHRPSEERINGKAFEMVVHLVHRDAEGRLAVLALLLERGAPQATIQTVWNNLPLETFETMQPTILLDPAEMLPARRDYYTYMGSMTSPPCSEGVLWMVMKQPVQASPAQMALFSRLYPLNARPIQPTNGRIIKESN